MNRLALAVSAIAALGCGTKKEEAAVAPPARAEPVKQVKPEAPVAEPAKFDPWLDAPRRADPPEPPKPPKPPEPPSPPPPPDDGFDTDKLKVPSIDSPIEAHVRDVRDVVRATAPELALVKISGSYLRKDGSLDPTYGKLELQLELLDGIDGIVDDPDRPTGAPVPDFEPAERSREQCPHLTFGGGGWVVEQNRCSKVKPKPGPRCTVAQIWGKAIAQGAPENAVAIVDFDARTTTWRFRISDKLRGVSFVRSYQDQCDASPAPVAPKPGVKRNPASDDLKNPF